MINGLAGQEYEEKKVYMRRYYENLNDVQGHLVKYKNEKKRHYYL